MAKYLLTNTVRSPGFVTVSAVIVRGSAYPSYQTIPPDGICVDAGTSVGVDAGFADGVGVGVGVSLDVGADIAAEVCADTKTGTAVGEGTAVVSRTDTDNSEKSPVCETAKDSRDLCRTHPVIHAAAAAKRIMHKRYRYFLSVLNGRSLLHFFINLLPSRYTNLDQVL
jgi:hypothetical protein